MANKEFFSFIVAAIFLIGLIVWAFGILIPHEYSLLYLVAEHFGYIK